MSSQGNNEPNTGKGSPEDILSQMFSFMNVGGGQDINELLNTLMRNTQINMLRQLRRTIDQNIKTLTAEGEESTDPEMDPYVILGISEKATRDEIDKAFKKKAKEVHPDVGGSQQEFIKVNAAYEAIKQFRGWK